MLVDIVCQCGRSTSVDDANSDGQAHCFACGKTLSLAPAQTVTCQTQSPTVDECPTIDSHHDLSTTTESYITQRSGAAIDDMQTTVRVVKNVGENHQDALLPGEATAVYDPLDSVNKEFQVDDDFVVEDTRTEGSSVAPSSDDFSLHEESLKFCTHAERILNADPFYRITRAKRSKPGVVDSNKGFVYGIHRIMRQHVKGGMGMINIAYDQFLKREVALKELFKDTTTDESIVHRFIVEAEITAQLEHPGIIPVHALGLDINGNPYYTMKLIRGKTFQEAIKQYFKAPSEQELKRLVRRFVSVCQTMSFVHNKGVIHRDLKPANIMLSDHGETLVMDWGIAKAYDTNLATESGIALSTSELQNTMEHNTTHPDLTLAGTVVGTPAFMSPEQASPDSQDVGPVSDIFSLGAVLFYLLTGRNAYTGKTSQEVLLKVISTNPPRPSDVARNIPPGLEAICMKAMSRSPKGRYQTANELVADLCNWLDGEPISAMKETQMERVWRYFRKNRQMSMSVFLMVLILFIIFTLSAILIDRGRQRAKFFETQSKIIVKRGQDIERDIQELRKELKNTQEACEKYRHDRDSTNTDELRAVYDKNLHESLVRAAALDSQIAELVRIQTVLRRIDQDIRNEK